ncbi:phosphoglycolate phosphatase [Pseudomonas sp. TE3786]
MRPDYELLIFDWDGTLVNSIGRIVAALHKAARECDLPPRSDAELKAIIGLGLPEVVVALYPDLDDAELAARYCRSYSASYLELESTPSTLFPGVAESMAAFRAAGYKLAVATGKGRHGLNRVLADQGWTDFFDTTRCADETASKPAPLMLEQILAECGVAPERALMVGDSLFDLDMARNAGMDSVAVGYGAQSLDTLSACGPTLMVEHFSELRAWLESRATQPVLGMSKHVERVE